MLTTSSHSLSLSKESMFRGKIPPNHHHQNNLKKGEITKAKQKPLHLRKNVGKYNPPGAASGFLIIASWAVGGRQQLRSERGSKISFCSAWHLRLYQPSARGPSPLQAEALVALLRLWQLSTAIYSGYPKHPDTMARLSLG